MADATRVLGIVNGTNIDKKSNPIAWITPLLDVSSAWQPLTSDEWPSDTQVFWPLAKGAAKDSLVVFHPKENPAGQRDRYVAADVQPVLEVLDRSASKDEDSLRVAFTSDSGGEQRAGTFLILGPGDDVFGPVRVVNQPGRHSVVEPAARHRVAVYRKADLDVRNVKHVGRIRLVQDKTLPNPYRYTDWDDDRAVVKRSLDFLVEQSKKSGTNALGLTKRVIDELAQNIASVGDTPEHLLRQGRLERARRVLEHGRQLESLSTVVLESLRQHPDVKAALDRMVEEERKSTQARLEAEFSKHRASLGELKSELDQVNAVLSEKKAALAQEEREAELVVTRIEEAVARRVADVLRQPETAIAEIPILRAILRPLRSDANAGPKVAPAASSTVLAWHVSGTRLQTPADVRKRLAQELKAHGASGEPSGALVAATLARKIPVVWGGGAQRALNAYADVIAHGRLWTVSVSPLLTRMPDLFGSVDQSARTFVPHADGLIDVIDGARRSKGYAVAVLEGINLAATEGFLLPLLNAIAADREIHVCHPRAIDPEDPYAAVLRFKWPRNLLLVATLIEGPTSLPLAGDLWRHSVLIRVDAAKTRDTRGGLELSELDPEIDTISLNAETSVAEHVFAEFEEFAGFIAPASEFAEHLVGSGTQREGEVAKALLLPLVSRHEMSEELAEKIARALNVDKQHARTLFLQTRGIVA